MNKNDNICLRLIVCGNGALAQSILNYKDAGPNVQIQPFDPMFISTKEIFKPIAIHTSKTGRQLPELIEYCEEQGIPLIQAATGIKLPEEFKIPIIEAPNLAMPIIATLKHLPNFINNITKGIGLDVISKSLIESHQESKGDSVPGTARKIADIASIAYSEIISERRPEIQSIIGVPEEHLARHAYHFLTLKFAGGLEIGLHTKVHGLKPYAVGAIILAKRIIELSPLPKEQMVWQMTEFI